MRPSTTARVDRARQLDDLGGEEPDVAVAAAGAQRPGRVDLVLERTDAAVEQALDTVDVAGAQAAHVEARGHGLR